MYSLVTATYTVTKPCTTSFSLVYLSVLHIHFILTGVSQCITHSLYTQVSIWNIQYVAIASTVCLYGGGRRVHCILAASPHMYIHGRHYIAVYDM